MADKAMAWPRPALGRGVAGDGQESRTFRAEPGRCGFEGPHRRQRGSRRRNPGSPVLLSRDQRVHRLARGRQDVVEQPGQCGPPVALAVQRLALPYSVGADKVVEGVPARGGLGEQVRAGQLAQDPASLVERQRRQGSQRRER